MPSTGGGPSGTPEHQPSDDRETPKTVEASIERGKEELQEYADKVGDEMTKYDPHIGELVNHADERAGTRSGETGFSEMAWNDQVRQYERIFTRDMTESFVVEVEAAKREPGWEALPEKKKMEKIAEIRANYQEQAQLAANIIIGKLAKLAVTGKPFTAQQLAEIRFGVQHDVTRLRETLSSNEHGSLMRAYAFLLGHKVEVTPEEKAADPSFLTWDMPAAQGVIATYLKDPGLASMRPTTWEVFSYLPEAKKTEALVKVKGQISARDYQLLVKEGIIRGAISVEEVEATGITLTPSDADELRALHKDAVDFKEEAHRYQTESYGARSIAHEALSGPSLFKLLVKGLSAVTVATNVGVAVGYGGGFKNAGGIVKSIATNEYVLGGAAAYAITTALEQNTSLGSALASHEQEIKSQKRKDLVNIVRSTPYGDKVRSLLQKPRFAHHLLGQVRLMKRMSGGESFDPIVTSKRTAMHLLGKQKERAEKNKNASELAETEEVIADLTPLFEDPAFGDEQFLELVEIVSTLNIGSEDIFNQEFAAGTQVGRAGSELT